jgi:oleate hydratase
MAGNITEKTHLYFVGGGIASLSGAVFAIRDGHVPGKNIHIFETMSILGGALDGAGSADTGYVCRGARKYDNTATSYGCTWDLMKTIPTLTDINISLYDEFVEFNNRYVKNFKGRLIDKNTKVDYVKTMGLNWGHRMKLIQLTFTPESWIENRRVDSWFPPSFFRTNLWFIFSSIFGFETYHDLMECRRYLRKFAHGLKNMIGGSPQDLEVCHPINQYESFILPVQKWLEQRGVDFMLRCKVTDLDFNHIEKEIKVKRILYTQGGVEKEIPVGKNDFVFVTNGSKVADSTTGSMTSPALKLETGKLDGSWTLWENLAKKRPGLGNPSLFTSQVDKTKWVVFTVTSKDSIFFDLFEKKTGNKPGFSDLVTFTDSGWMFSVQVPAQPHFLNQPKGVCVWIGYALNSNVPGDYVKKNITECSGEEILTEVCCQFGFEKDLPHILATSICIPSLEPYVTAQFMPRKKSDRPLVIPEGSANLAFIGQFVESGECVFLVEDSIRTAQVAVYKFLNVNRKIQPIFKGIEDPKAAISMIRALFT